MRGSEAGGGATRSIHSGADGGCLTCGSTSQHGISGDGKGVQTAIRGGAGGLAEKGGDGGRWKLDRVKGNITLAMQVSVLFRNSGKGSEQTDKSQSKQSNVLSSDEGSEQTDKSEFKQSIVLSRNSNECSEQTKNHSS